MVKSRSVMIVDDEPNIRLMFRTTLQSAGYATIEAGDGPTALLRLQKDHPDLVLLDLKIRLSDRICGWKISDPAQLWLDGRVSPPPSPSLRPGKLRAKRRRRREGTPKITTKSVSLCCLDSGCENRQLPRAPNHAEKPGKSKVTGRFPTHRFC